MEQERIKSLKTNTAVWDKLMERVEGFEQAKG